MPEDAFASLIKFISSFSRSFSCRTLSASFLHCHLYLKMARASAMFLRLYLVISYITTAASSSFSAYDKCHSDAQTFANSLGLNGSVSTNVVNVLISQKCSNTSATTIQDRAQLACLASKAIFGSAYLDAASADYTNRTDVNWYVKSSRMLYTSPISLCLGVKDCQHCPKFACKIPQTISNLINMVKVRRLLGARQMYC